MTIPVLVERVDGNGFRVRSGEPLVLTTEGATQEEALQKLRELIQKRFAGGAELIELDVTAKPTPPWARFVGRWKADDPLIAEWEKEVEEYRRSMDEDPNVL
jgi:hypothetical protein